MRASEILAGLKAADSEARASDAANYGVVMLLKQDEMLARLVACFRNVAVPADGNPDEECPANTPADARIRWLWARIDPDPIPRWIALVGLPDAPHVRRAIQVAIDNRIVLPDGTLSRWADRFLAGYVRSVLGGA